MSNINPNLLICGLALCWPGLIPMIVVAIVARRYDVRNPFTSRHRSNIDV